MRGATLRRWQSRAGCNNFNPRTPCGVRPRRAGLTAFWLIISIHAPRAGCDAERLRLLALPEPDFNPRTPCGVRRGPRGRFDEHFILFQSTYPVRGATCVASAAASPPSYFNPRTPFGVRLRRVRCAGSRWYFNPRTPCGVRRASAPLRPHRAPISIHAPRAGCDDAGNPGRKGQTIFQSTHPVRGATRPARAI